METRETSMSIFNPIRFSVLLSLGLVLTGGQTSTHAQQDIIANCASETSAEARIRCLENALLAKETVNTELSRPAEPSISEPNIAPAPVVSPAKPEPIVAVTAKPEPVVKAAELGSEQIAPIRKAEETNERTVFSVASFEIAHPNKMRFFLENGQVWQQIQGDDQRLSLSKKSLGTVEIWKSRFGGYKLRIPDKRRTLRVRRLR